MTGIVLDNVSKYYKVGDQEFRVLNHVSITVHPGQFVAVIGPSGSGKSTFLSIAGALLEPSEGDVIINGIRLSGLKPKEQIGRASCRERVYRKRVAGTLETQ